MTIKVIYKDNSKWTHRDIKSWKLEGEIVLLFRQDTQIEPYCIINMREVKAVYEGTE